MQNKSINLLAFLLTLVGYMTLTISMPLIHDIARSYQLPIHNIRLGMSLLFIMFSLSAIFLASLSDVIGTKTVLVFAQLTSIAGLIIVSISDSLLFFYFGLFLMGAGTGCYSSISRSTLSRYAENKIKLRQTFSMLSATVIIAPLASSYLGIGLAIISWRYAYLAMAMIEVSLFFFARFVLSQMPEQKLIARQEVISNLKQLLNNKYYILNVVLAAFLFSLYLAVIMGNLIVVLKENTQSSLLVINIIIFMITMSYLTGIFIYRSMASRPLKLLGRMGTLLLFLIGITLLSINEKNTLILLFSLMIIAIYLGFSMPMATASGTAVIKQGHGMSAAFLTFSFSIGMAFWSVLQAHIGLNDLAFLKLSLWISFIVATILNIVLGAFKP